MNEFFINHLYDIFTVSQALSIDGYTCEVSEAFARFKADVAAGKAEDYNTGNILPDFNFAGAKAEWDKLGEAGQKQAIEDYDNFVDQHYLALCVAFTEGREKMQAFVAELEAQ